MHRLATNFVLIAAMFGTCACSHLPADSNAARAAAPAPYPRSRLITAVTWDFSGVERSRKAHGSDLWPCTWARDGNEYCAWGDGGGFDGDDDNVGRVSLGFARVSGIPLGDGSSGFVGKNVWGAPPYAENPATFGGKIVSMVSVDGIIYAIGALWTEANTADPVRKGSEGSLVTLVWSRDLGKSWQIAPWSSPKLMGTFLNFGRDNAGAIDSYVYIYYRREEDTTRLHLRRVAKDQLENDPATAGITQYFAGVDRAGRAVWTSSESESQAIFHDQNNVDYPDVIYVATLNRYLMTVGHYRSGDFSDASIGQFGIFDAPHPWGPWSTVAYYDDWGNYGPDIAGDFLGVHIPLKWVGPKGTTLWFVFSGLHEWDSFNLIKASLRVRQ
jgi:hypothetical protein